MSVHDGNMHSHHPAERLTAYIKEQLIRNYTETVVDHTMNPRNVQQLEDPDGRASLTGDCGDTMEIFINVQEDSISDVAFRTDGCGATIACGSMVTELARNRRIQEAYQINQKDVLEALGGLPEGNVHCALLAANTMRLAVQDYLSSRNQPWKKMYRTD